MKNKFDELTKQAAQSVARRAALKKFSRAWTVLALSFALPIGAANPSSVTSSVIDAAGDAVFPYQLYDRPVPPWIDIVSASITFTRGVFHFEIQVNTDIPANGDPGFNPPVNHLGGAFGLQTDRKTATQFNFFGQQGQQGNYYFNFLVGAMYFAQDAGVGLGLGWHAFLQGPNGITEVPLVIRGDTYIFETSAASLGNPASINWAVGTECDPVPIPDESKRTAILVDYAPDQGYATWPPQP
jgi:hypothetical protein